MSWEEYNKQQERKRKDYISLIKTLTIYFFIVGVPYIIYKIWFISEYPKYIKFFLTIFNISFALVVIFFIYSKTRKKK